jgi:membrane-associated phospholipid phosphatase
VIFGYSFWTLRGLRWVGLVVNALLIAGTPINGGHYFVDVFAGAVVAVVAIWGARRATAARYSAQPSAGTAALAGFKPRPIVGA